MSAKYADVEQAGHWVLCNVCSAPIPPAAKARRWDPATGYVYCNRNCQAHELRIPSRTPRPSANANLYGTGPAVLASIARMDDLTVWYGSYGAPYLLPQGEMPVGSDLQGAYVQAWVWIDLRPDQGQDADERLIEIARIRWQRNGDIEIDDDAHVSRSYVDG